MITMRLEVEPIAKGRARFGRNGSVRTPSKTRLFETTLGWMARREFGKRTPLVGPLKLSVRFVFVPGKSVKRTHHTIKPDLSNLLKAIEDALNGIVWRDDSQIISASAAKLYDVSGGPARIELQIEEIQP
jgi:crossover junction endodeoxyribonuclease RusA